MSLFTLISRCAFLLVASVSPLSNAAVPASTVKETVTVWSQGVRLAADVYKPVGLAADAKLPGLLLIPGWGGNKQNLERNYAPYFAEQGFIVLAFDYKGWGDSDGPVVIKEPLCEGSCKDDEASTATVALTHIRKVINPASMSADVRAALSYLGSEPQVMPNNLGVWGSSMGGGLAVVAAANDDRIKALVDQMGPVNYQHNLREFPTQKMRFVEALVARGKLPPFPGPNGAGNPGLQGYPDWVAMKRFNPLSQADRLQVPTLIIDAAEETLFDITKNGQLLHDTIKGRVESHYITYPGGHYDLYKGKNLTEARKAALQWFVAHLKSN